MKRRLLNFSAVVSLLCCVAVAGMWAKVHWSAAAYDRAYRAGRRPGGIMPAYSYESGYARVGARVFFVISYRSNLLALGWNKNGASPGSDRFGWEPAIDYQGVPIDGITPRHWRLWRFGLLYRTVERPNAPPITYAGVALPHWAAIILAAILPAACAPRWAAAARATARRWRRGRPGACRVCGYNLTGNVSGVCPECGAPVPNTQP
jgi:hypothetical protein